MRQRLAGLSALCLALVALLVFGFLLNRESRHETVKHLSTILNIANSALEQHSLPSAIAAFDQILLNKKAGIPADIWTQAQSGLAKAQQEWQSANKSQDAAQEEFSSMFDHASSELQSGDADAAVAGFTAIAQRGTEVSPFLRARATHGLLKAQELQHSSWSVRIAELFTNYRPIGPIAIVLCNLAVIGALLWLVRWCLRHWPLHETLISFEDLSPGERPSTDPDRVLTSSVLSQLQNHQPIRMAGLQMDIMPGAQDPGFGGLRPAQYTGHISGIVPADHPIKVGTVEFTPSDIIEYVRRWFDRPNKGYLLGWVLSTENGTTAVAHLMDNSKKLGRGLAGDNAWRVHVARTEGRERAISALAAQIMVGTGNSAITTNWQSLRSFHDGICTLQLEYEHPLPRTCLFDSRACFEEALTHDPGNWMARFQLALVLCKVNEPRAALGHFAVLESIFKRATEQTSAPLVKMKKPSKDFEAQLQRSKSDNADDDPCASASPAFQRLLQHLDEFPECPFLVLYNKAMALSALPECEAVYDALDLLRRITTLKDTPCPIPEFSSSAAKLSVRSHIELMLYALSSRAHILASLCVARCPLPNHHDHPVDHRCEIDKAVTAIEDLCLPRQEQHWRSFQTARAVALSAQARVLAAEREATLASQKLYSALAAEPMFIEAYLQLAALYMEEKQQLDSQWDLLAESWLKRATEVNPECKHTKLLIALLYSEPLVGKARQAQAILEQLEGVPEAKVILAKNTFDNGSDDDTIVQVLKELFREIRLRSVYGKTTASQLQDVICRSRVNSIQPNAQFRQLLERLAQILNANLTPVEEGEHLLRSIRECRIPANAATADASG